MVALGVALALTAAALDLLLTEHVGVIYDVGFVALCVALALAVRPRDFFTVGVLPPLLMLTTFLLLAMSRSEAIARPEDGLVQAVVSGLSHHSLGLVVGYLLCLAVLLVRIRILALRGAATPDAVSRSGPGLRLPV